MKFLLFNMFVSALCVLFLIKLRWPANKSIYDIVYERYGQKVLRSLRVYEKNLNRYNKAGLDIGYLEKCKRYGVYPKFLNFKLSRPEFHQTQACDKFKSELVGFEIRSK